jgi:hypothetical protein
MGAARRGKPAPPSRPHGSATPARPSAPGARHRGQAASPISRVISRETGAPRFGGCDHADRRSCAALLAAQVPRPRAILYTDAWPSAPESPPAQAMVGHRPREWAREAEHAGVGAVHGHTGEGAGAALRTSLRAFRGVHTPSWHRYMASDQALVKAKRVTSPRIRRMCVGIRSPHTSHT